MKNLILILLVSLLSNFIYDYTPYWIGLYVSTHYQCEDTDDYTSVFAIGTYNVIIEIDTLRYIDYEVVVE